MKLPHLNFESEKLWDREKGPRWESSSGSQLDEAHARLQSKFKSGEVGFYDLPTDISETEIRKMKQLAERLHNEFEGAVLFGIGGSYLGPAAITQSLASENPKFKLHWLSNIDPSQIRRAEKLVKENKFAAVVMSKSGGTIETLSSFFHLSPSLDPKGYVCITDPKLGELRRLATANHWESLAIAPSVGGRFSVLTAVGLFPTLLAGLNAEALLEGARDMRKALSECTPSENPAYRLAMAKYLWDSKFHHSVHYLMPYEQNLKFLADWYVQLWGESLGKKKLSTPTQSVGFTPASALGTTDQHSLLQLFKEGPSDKLVGFMEVLNDGEPIAIRKPSFAVQGQDYLFGHNFQEITHFASKATEQSLNNSGTPTYRIQLPHLDEKALGAFFFFYEVSCALAGELYGVDAFNQPGVEETKKLLRAAL